jgi:hypothetical protein
MSLKDLSSSLGVKKGFNKNEKVVSQDKPKSDKPFDTHAQIKTIPSYKLMAVQIVTESSFNGMSSALPSMY